MNYLKEVEIVVSIPGVKPAEKQLPTTPYRDVLAKTVSKNIEACDVGVTELIAMNDPCNGLIQSLNYAYDMHYPVVLSPDIIWTTIAQGFARYINLNAEKVRHHFVKHEGKEALAVYRDRFILGSPDNDWAGVFPEFSEQIAKHIPEGMHTLILNNFSTTTPLDKVVSEIVLMDAMQSYFSYECYTCCGIPSVVIIGTRDDWSNILGKVLTIAGNFPDLSMWCQKLIPILKQFLATFRGEFDTEFWANMYKLGGGSGGPFINGWITHLFPYLQSYETDSYTQKNRAIFDPAYKETGFFSGINPDKFPPSFSTVPFNWIYYGRTLPYQFIGGIFGAAQNDEDLAVVPKMGWAVKPYK